MHLGYLHSPLRGEGDRLLAELAATLTAQSVRLAGVVQTNTECADDRACDMDVQVLPAGPIIRISQSLGPHATGCRLDSAALEQAVASVERELERELDQTRPQLLIVNKFGKHEASGGGFRPVIGAALSMGIPVLLSVSSLNQNAFSEFADGLCEPVPADTQSVLLWARNAIAASALAA
jgi:hypothetical protein